MTQLPPSSPEHYAEQQRITAAVLLAAGEVWGEQPPTTQDFDGWFEANVDALTVLAAAGRSRAMASSSAYVAASLAEQGIDRDPTSSIDTSSLIGVASDGRPLETLIQGAMIRTKGEIKRAVAAGSAGDDPAVVTRAWATGRETLQRRMQTQIADAERTSTHLEILVRPRIGYCRVVRAGACSRCTVLAGRFYRWSDGFLRHPLCMCRHVPSTQDVADDLTTDPQKAFDALTPAEQNKIFTINGARAIREGADIGQVVNVRRGNTGLQTGAGRITTTKIFGQDLYTSSEGTTRRGFAGKLIRDRGQNPSTSPRLMPETIFEIAESRDDALRLLELNGYAFDRSKAGNRGSLTGREPEPPRPKPLPRPAPIDLDAVPLPPPTVPTLTPAEKKAAALAKKRATAERKVTKSQTALDAAPDQTALDAMPLQARVIVDRAELRKVDAGKPDTIPDAEKLARKVLDVETKLADPKFDVFHLSNELGPKWRDEYRDEWRRNLQDVLHNDGRIVVAPTTEWPFPGLKRKGALERHRTDANPSTLGRTNAEIINDVRRTNPNYFMSGTDFKINCQRVVQAYELRVRGYDVTANPNVVGKDKGLRDEDIFGGWSPDGTVADGKNFEKAKSPAGMRAIAKAWGPGARGWITVDWKGNGGAHIYNVEVDRNGIPRFYDAQPGIDDVESYGPQISFAKVKAGRNGARMYRVDELFPTPGTSSLVASNPTFIQGVEEVPR